MFEPISYNLWKQDKAAFAERLGQSFRETGFAVIKDHPVPAPVIDKNLEAAKAFFSLPDAVKRKYHDPDGAGQRGYTPFGAENAKGVKAHDLKEFWHTGRRMEEYAGFMKPTPSVAEVPQFDDASYALFEALDDFGRQLLRGVALFLELEEDWFESTVNHGNSILRLLHYPPQTEPQPEGSVRAAAHEDINVITLLLGAEEAGLQAKHRSGKWLDINPPEGALVINCGDMLQRLTAGYLPSTSHRVLNPSPERSKFSRYSTPYFLHFNADFMIEPLEGCTSETHPGEPPISASDYLMERLAEIGLTKK